MSLPRFPLTVLTGFLGAGKTTVLNALLAQGARERVAVIVNELGQVGLDNDLIDAVDDGIALMDSGCLCCSLLGDLSQTVETLCTRRAAGELAFDRLVIETTGLADPGPILQQLATDPFLVKATQLAGVVTVVDAVNGPGTLDAHFEAVSQVASADLIVLSKTDMVDVDQTKAFAQRLAGLNPTAAVIHAVQGQGVADQIWGLSGHHGDVTPATVLPWSITQPAPSDPFANLSGLAAPSTPAPATMPPHDGRIATAAIRLDHPIDGAIFNKFQMELASMRGDKLLRAKGLVFLDDDPKPWVFHGVQRTFDPATRWDDWDGTDRQSRVVLIARDVPERRLQRDLERLRNRTF